jgi:excisionase family DNA binding protein
MDDISAREPDLSLLVSVPDARRHLGGVSSQTIYRLIANGKLRLVKVGRRSLIPRADLEALAESGSRSEPR